MSVQGAKIIDLEEWRQSRRNSAAQSMPAVSQFAAPFAMTWVPVWFVPVYMPEPLPGS